MLESDSCYCALHQSTQYHMVVRSKACGERGGTHTGVQFSSVQINPLTDWVVGGDMGDESAEILFQSFLQEALVNSSGMGRDVHFLMMSIQHFLCQPWCHPPSKVTWRMVLGRLSWRVTCPNHASFRLLTVARRGSYGSWSCSAPSHWSCTPSRKYREVSSWTWFQKPGSFFSESASRVHVSQL